MHREQTVKLSPTEPHLMLGEREVRKFSWEERKDEPNQDHGDLGILAKLVQDGGLLLRVHLSVDCSKPNQRSHSLQEVGERPTSHKVESLLDQERLEDVKH